jgi:hypothetical protein
LRLREAERELALASDVASAAQLVASIASQVEQRKPEVDAHTRALATAREQLRALPLFEAVRGAVEESRAEVSALLLLALRDRLNTALQVALDQPLAATLTTEIAHLTDQLEALRAYGEAARCPGPTRPSPA